MKKEKQNTSISKQEKLRKSFELIEKFGISNYEISQNTGISEAGLSTIKNRGTKNPRELTVNAIYDYLVNKYDTKSIEIENTEKAQKPITNNSTELVDFKNLPINKQLEIIHKQSETLQKENRILKREIDRMSLMMELYFSTLMVHFDIDSPDEKSQEDDKKTKTQSH